MLYRLDDEIGELEKRYQEQRKRLLAEVHVERENIERTSEATLAIKEKENERKWEMKSIEMQKKIEALQLEHQVIDTITLNFFLVGVKYFGVKFSKQFNKIVLQGISPMFCHLSFFDHFFIYISQPPKLLDNGFIQV